MNDLKREKFEMYCNFWRLPLEINENGFYEDSITQRHWNTWCAAIESLVVEQQKPVNLNQCLACGGYHGSGNLPCPLMQFTCLGS